MTQVGEDRLKRIVTAVLEPHFFVHPEVWGTIVGGTRRLRIDFIITPRTELIEKGFTASVVGIEVKEPDGDTSKAARVANQARAYADTKFDQFGLPDFVLIFPPIDEHVTGHEPAYIRGALRMLKTLMQMGGCGSLHCDERSGRWGMVFCESQSFWNSNTGRGNLQSILNHRNWRCSR